MSSAIDVLFGNFKCTKCGKKLKEKCSCYALKDPVTLTCTECPRTIVIESEPDFMGMKRILTICPTCGKDPKKKAHHESLFKTKRRLSPNETSTRRKKT